MSAKRQKNFLRRFFENLRRIAFVIFFLTSGAFEIFAQRPLGLDVSSYQGSSINWTNVGAAGYLFAWAKATEGVSITDPDFTINAVNAKKAGVHIGAYDFAHPEDNSPSAEANHFWSVAGNYILNDGLSVQPALDYETFTAPNNIPVGAASYADWANQWCSNIVSKAAAAGVVVKPVIYISTCDAGNLNSSVASSIPWIANPSGLSPQTGSPWSSTSCSSSGYQVWGAGVWTVWQYSWTDTVPGIPGTGDMDLDVFNGTTSQMLAALVITNTGTPYLTSQPLNYAVDTGATASLTGSANGTAPLAYQWFFNGAQIADATNAVLEITNAQTNSTGNYSFIVTNVYGSATSSASALLVYPVQTTVFADNFDANSATNWIVNKSSTDNSVTFNFDYSSLGIPSAPHSTNGSTLGVQMKANLNKGVVAALSISPTNQTFSGDYRLHFDAWINVNGPLPGGGGSTEFLTAGIGTSGNRVEWTGNASADGIYFSADGDGGVAGTSTTSGDYCAYSNAMLLATSSGVYLAGTDTTARDNANFYYYSIFPVGQSAPVLQQNNYPQQSGNLNAGTFGLAWHDVIVSCRGNSVDWVVDGVRLAYVPQATFNSSNVFVGYWDPFASLSSNNVVNFGLLDNVRVEVPAVAPVLVLQPGEIFQLIGSGQTGATYILETSTNLADWTSLTNLTATNGVFEFDFAPLDNDQQRFFRARVGP
jgi:GH25 family lysozyme M1 (1,4-beta-N-acetylmuramidase)